MDPTSLPRPASRGSRSLWAGDWLGAALVGVGLFLGLVYIAVPVNPFDEGILLTHSWLLSQGFQPHRDFYTQYPPGIYLLIAALWRIVGTSPWALRWLAIGLRVAIALLAGHLAAAALGRRMLLAVCGLTLIWLDFLEPIPSAWLAGLAVALAALQAWISAQARPRFLSDFLAGLGLASISCFRHDLFLTLGAVLMLLGVSQKRVPQPTRAAGFAVGALVPLALVWLPLVSTVGWRLVLDDLILDQLRYVAPGRHLPMPPLLAPIGGVPAILGFPLSGAFVIALSGPFLAALLLVAPGPLGVVDRRPVALLGALAIADVPHLLSRVDEVHAVSVLAPSLALAGTLIAGLATRMRSSLGAAALLGAGTVSLLLPLGRWLVATPLVMPTLPTGPPPYHGLPASPERRAAIAFVARYTRPGERIYVGPTQHRRIFANEVDFYFFARRPGATRYLQFDVNMQNRSAVQRAMIAQIEAHRPRLAVLSPCCLRDEPNDSMREGSGELDGYLERHYRVVALIGDYRMLWRSDVPSGP